MIVKRSRQRGNLVCVATTAGQMPAQVLKSKLEAAGIPVLLEYESAGLVLGLTVNGLGEVRVMVPQEFEQDALLVIRPEETLAEGDDAGAENESADY